MLRSRTAPFVNRDEYLAGKDWKRGVHAEHGTILVETYSYERQAGRLLDALAEKLAPHVTLNPRPPATIYDRVIELGQADGFSRMLGTFLRQFKSGGYQFDICAQKAEKLKMGARGRALLAVFDPVYREYQIYMRNWRMRGSLGSPKICSGRPFSERRPCSGTPP